MLPRRSTQRASGSRGLLDGPIIGPGLHPSIGENIQGPSLIRVPDWIGDPLGKYYLYFADHKGRYIRLAYADDPLGPWHVHPPGSLTIEKSHFLTEPPEPTPEQMERFRSERSRDSLSHDRLTEATTPHIASPDVHVDDENRRIIMYFHGLEDVGRQVSRVATSSNGIDFTARPDPLGRTYMRAFEHQGLTHVLAMPGQFYRSADPLGRFEEGPLLFNPNMRHSALLKRGDTLFVFWTQRQDAPERIFVSTIDLTGDWMTWKESPPVEVLRPEHDWEGADAPIEPSVASTAYGRVNQLRDPAIFEHAASGRVFLLYAVAGESGIAIAEVHLASGQGSPDAATDVTRAEIEAVRTAPKGGIDRQVKVVDIGQDTNVAVGILHRDAVTRQDGPVRGIAHAKVTEVYYIASGSGVLMTGGTMEDTRSLPDDTEVVQVAVGPSVTGSSRDGHTRRVSEGDVVVIPAGVFHGWVEIDDHVTYLSIRPDPERVLPAGYVNPAAAR